MLSRRMLPWAALAVSLAVHVVSGGAMLYALNGMGGVTYVAQRLGFANGAPRTDGMHAQAIAAHAAYPHRDGEIHFVGDSLTHRFPWAQCFADLPVYNFGIGNDTTSDLLNRVETFAARQPDKIFLMIGTNDLEMGRFADHDLFALNTERLLERIAAITPATRVYIQSVPPTQNPLAAGAAARFNERLERLADERGAVYIDLHSHFVDERGDIRAGLFTDGTHLSTAGYAIWARVISPYVYGDEPAPAAPAFAMTSIADDGAATP
ncbi:MAG: GDSL-type esterase/lipase family protein [Planctomycetota bacterium]